MVPPGHRLGIHLDGDFLQIERPARVGGGRRVDVLLVEDPFDCSEDIGVLCAVEDKLGVAELQVVPPPHPGVAPFGDRRRQRRQGGLVRR